MINFDYFDAIYCVNLKHRTDRWELSEKEFDKIGILDRVERFDAIMDDDPKRGFYESHMQIIKLAHERKLKNVLIFEDDVAFYKDMCDEKFNKSIDVLKTKDWEFYYLGGFERRIRPRPVYNRLTKKLQGEYDENEDYLWECKSVGWTQSYAINSCIFERLIEKYNDENFFQHLIDNHKGLLDVWYQEGLLPKTYITMPTVTTQYDIVSDISRTRTNRSLRLPKEDNT